MTRKAFFAGSFYPSDKEELHKKITGLLSPARKVRVNGSPKILVSPHAGLEYSGEVAAWGYKQLEEVKVKNFILLGVSHRSIFSHAALYNEDSWASPLGRVKVNKRIVDDIVNYSQAIVPDPASHEKEHCLEMQLIFLQKINPDFKILPILVGNPSGTLCKNLARTLAAVIRRGACMIVSSDLSHYPPYDTAREVDGETIKAILSGKSSNFLKKIKIIEDKYRAFLDTPACGYKAVYIALLTAKMLELEPILIKYQNSGDKGGDRENVVGYCSIGFYQPYVR